MTTLQEVDQILEAYNIERTGKEIRKALFDYGCVIVRVDEVPNWKGYSRFEEGVSKA